MIIAIQLDEQNCDLLMELYKDSRETPVFSFEEWVNRFIDISIRKWV